MSLIQISQPISTVSNYFKATACTEGNTPPAIGSYTYSSAYLDANCTTGGGSGSYTTGTTGSCEGQSPSDRTVKGGSKCVRTCNANNLAGFSKARVRLAFAEGNFRNNSRGWCAEDLKIIMKKSRSGGMAKEKAGNDLVITS
jgi:hypothetical protein